MEMDGYETWVCLHTARVLTSYVSAGGGPCDGDPWFCWVFHETLMVFTPWGPNSEVRLIK